MQLGSILLLLTATAVRTTHAFNASPQLSRPTTALFGGKRRGRLTNNVSLDEDGNVARIMTKREKQKLGNSKMKKKNDNASSSATISPLLAEWAKDDNISSSASSKESTPSTTVSTSATTFIPFDDNDETTDKKKRKANKKAKRAALTAVQTQQIDTLLEEINNMLQTTNLDRVELVSLIKSLVTIGSSSASSNSNDQVLLPTLKSIVSTRPTKDETSPCYRLAWVGSDDAICHIGTSLHKVPLARLQEVFLTLGYNRWDLYEVIRIIGPFPNVRNTLKGDVKLRKLKSSSSDENNREGVRMEISYTSMIDGTGKEILAGKEDNIKYVNLDVWFANEKVIVCTVPSENDDDDGLDGEDPFMGDGSNVLFFVGEENLDEQLEKLRAA